MFIPDIFRSAAEAGPLDILKLYNLKGHLIKISPRLEANSPNNRYKLEVVAAQYEGKLDLIKKKTTYLHHQLLEKLLS